MRIAVSYINGMIFPHFGHSEQFKVYDVEDGQIIKETIVNTNGQGHGALATFLQDVKADTLVCGGIGGCAIQALHEMGIELYAGVSGNADEAVAMLIEGTLPQINGQTCHSHNDEHHCGGHHCCH